MLRKLFCMEQGRFPNRLKLYRETAGYSQKKVSSILGLGDTSILSRWERGITSPNIKQILWLSRLYNSVPHDLYHELWNSILSVSDLSAPTEPFSSQESFYL